jgi:hypothetical protein
MFSFLRYYLLKNIMEMKKSTTKMATREMTTAAVVDSPTPLAQGLTLVHFSAPLFYAYSVG